MYVSSLYSSKGHACFPDYSPVIGYPVGSVTGGRQTTRDKQRLSSWSIKSLLWQYEAGSDFNTTDYPLQAGKRSETFYAQGAVERIEKYSVNGEKGGIDTVISSDRCTSQKPTKGTFSNKRGSGDVTRSDAFPSCTAIYSYRLGNGPQEKRDIGADMGPCGLVKGADRLQRPVKGNQQETPDCGANCSVTGGYAVGSPKVQGNRLCYRVCGEAGERYSQSHRAGSIKGWLKRCFSTYAKAYGHIMAGTGWAFHRQNIGIYSNAPRNSAPNLQKTLAGFFAGRSQFISGKSGLCKSICETKEKGPSNMIAKSLYILVEPRRIELLTSSLPAKRSPS